jgi:hypothetical protein
LRVERFPLIAIWPLTQHANLQDLHNIDDCDNDYVYGGANNNNERPYNRNVWHGELKKK